MEKDKSEKDINQDRPRPVMKMYLSIHWEEAGKQTQAVNNPAPLGGMGVEITVPESMERFIFPMTTSSYDWERVRARAETELYKLMMNMAQAVINGRNI